MFGKIVSAWRILRLGEFYHCAYARRYLRSPNLALLSLVHFVLLGEAKGYCPNPFFDPGYFRSLCKGKGYSDYLIDQKLWIFSTCDVFQADWYLDEYGALVSSCMSPLAHFLRHGIAQGLRPSEDFETDFVLRCRLRDETSAREALFELLTSGVQDLCLSGKRLRSCQQEFLASISVHVRRLKHTARRPNLLFIQAGRDFSARFTPDRSFDVLVNFYEAAFPLPDDVEYVLHQRGTKTTAVAKLLERHREILLGYESVMLLDDDVAITQVQISQLFALRSAHGLDLLQPSLTARSAGFFPFLKQPLAGTGLVAMTAIEIMMPVVSRRVFEELGGLFTQSVSGWGLDLLLSQAVRTRYGETVALAADIVCEHLRPVDVRNGRFYRMLSDAGINPSAEAGCIAVEHGLNDKINAVRPLRRLEPEPKIVEHSP